MTFSPHWFPTWILWIAHLIFVPMFLFFITKQRVPNETRLIVACALTAFLWLLNVQVEAGHLSGMAYHLLGLNAAALILGAPSAFLLGCAWVLAFGLWRYGFDFLNVFSLNALCVALPACFLNALGRRVALRVLPKQVFVYIFINGFLSGALGMIITGAIVAAVLHSANVFSGSVVWGAAFPVFFLLTWGEAFLSGILSAICVAFKPELLGTFDDTVYLAKKQNQIWKD